MKAEKNFRAFWNTAGDIFSRIISGPNKMYSTRLGELTNDPDLRRINEKMERFLCGQKIFPDNNIPREELVCDKEILDGGWLHPVQRLKKLEEEHNGEIVGLLWTEENWKAIDPCYWVEGDLNGKIIPWCEAEMQTRYVKVTLRMRPKS